MSALATLKAWARRLRQQSLMLYFAARDPRTPLPVRLFALAIVAYAFSPVDLIPDFIPVLGYLDDLLILPLAIALLIRFVPHAVREAAERDAAAAAEKPVSLGGAAVVVAIWLLVIVLVVRALAD